MNPDELSWEAHYQRHGTPLEYAEPSGFLTQSLEKLNLLKDRTPGLICADIGCGSGTRNETLLQQLADTVVHLDASFTALSNGIGSVGKLAIVGSAASLPLRSDAFDFVVISDLFMHLRRWEVYIAELRRILKPGGLLFMNWLGLEDCQRERAISGDDGLVLSPGVPIVFRNAEAIHDFTDEGFTEVLRQHEKRLDPPHPEFFDEPHIHDEWSAVFRK